MGTAVFRPVSEAQHHAGLYQICPGSYMILFLPGPQRSCRNAHSIVHPSINRRAGAVVSAFAVPKGDFFKGEDYRE